MESKSNGPGVPLGGYQVDTSKGGQGGSWQGWGQVARGSGAWREPRVESPLFTPGTTLGHGGATRWGQEGVRARHGARGPDRPPQGAHPGAASELEGMGWPRPCRGQGGQQGQEAGEEAGHPRQQRPTRPGYLSSMFSGMPASIRAARNCARTPRMLLMKPLESGKRGKPMSG